MLNETIETNELKIIFLTIFIAMFLRRDFLQSIWCHLEHVISGGINICT